MDSDYSKHNLIFHTKIEHLFLRIFLQPLIWILGTILIASAKELFSFGNTTFLLFLVIYWVITSRYFPILYPLYVIASYDIPTNRTNISAGIMNSRVSGQIKNILEFDI